MRNIEKNVMKTSEIIQKTVGKVPSKIQYFNKRTKTWRSPKKEHRCFLSHITAIPTLEKDTIAFQIRQILIKNKKPTCLLDIVDRIVKVRPHRKNHGIKRSVQRVLAQLIYNELLECKKENEVLYYYLTH